MNTAVRRGIPTQVLFGSLLLVIGVLLFLRSLGLLEGEIFRFWPLLLVAVGLLKLATAANPVDRLIGMGLLAFGSLRMAATAFRLDVGPLDILATVLIVVGAAIVWRGVRGTGFENVARVEAMRDYIDALAFMGGYGTKCVSQRFRGGEVSVLMGGIELDLRGASMEAPAVMDVFVMWGGIEIRVPDDWDVELRGTPILAGFEDKTRPQPNAGPKRLIVRGVAIMAGVELKN
jgi:hypothetical protein